MSVPPRPKVLAFDVFGTVVDWRASIARESAGFLALGMLPGFGQTQPAPRYRSEL
jgi:2-haloacid dehalogenase